MFFYDTRNNNVNQSGNKEFVNLSDTDSSALISAEEVKSLDLSKLVGVSQFLHQLPGLFTRHVLLLLHTLYCLLSKFVPISTFLKHGP